MSTKAEGSFFFSEADIALFSRVSGDCNPLHLSMEYARRTAYGQPVVFGCLGALACLGRIGAVAAFSDTAFSLQAEFLRPMFQGVNYRVENNETEEASKAQLLDGSIPVVSLVVKRVAAASQRAPIHGIEPQRRQPATRRPEEIVAGVEAAGGYTCDRPALRELAQRWGVDERFTLALAWSSYLVGMELPGEVALFSKLVLNFPETAADRGELRHRVAIQSVDSRIGRARIEVALESAGAAFASGEFWSFVRPRLEDEEEIDAGEVRSDSLAGRTAVLIGSSRGLGAAMRRALEMRGAAVYGIARSAASENARMEIGDAADHAALRRLRERVEHESGRLDFLVCNASPPIPSLRLEPNAAERIARYVDEVVRLTLTPLTEFLDLLNQSAGCVVIVSSTAVEQPVREWPHYVAAKHAIEALGRVAVMQYPKVRTLIVRPSKLLTSLTNTPMGRRGAARPAKMARRIAEQLENPPAEPVTILS